MRLFLSCAISSDISEYLLSLEKSLPEIKHTIPQQFDLTIKFFKDVEDNQKEQLCTSLQQTSFHSFTAHLDDIHVFGERFIHIVWIGLHPNEPFISLHEQIEERTPFQKDPNFQPHITIARIKSLKNHVKFLSKLSKISIKPLPLVVDKLILFESQLTPQGPIHIPIMEIPALPETF